MKRTLPKSWRVEVQAEGDRLLVQALEIPFSLTLAGPRLVTGTLRCYAPQGGPVVDKFGQWNRKDWPGKIHSHKELMQRMHAEDRELAAVSWPAERGKYG